jgi:hypothetical protein
MIIEIMMLITFLLFVSFKMIRQVKIDDSSETMLSGQRIKEKSTDVQQHYLMQLELMYKK